MRNTLAFLFSLLLCVDAGAQIARLDAMTSSDGANLSFSVSAGSDRLLVCTFHGDDGPTGIATVSQVDYGDQTNSFTLVQREDSDGDGTGITFAEIWYTLDSTITAATGTTVAPTWSVTPDEWGMTCASYTGASQSGTAIDNNTAFRAGTTPNPLVADLVEASGNLLVGAFTHGNGNTCSWNASMTEQNDFGLSGARRGCTADRLSSTGSNVDIEVTSNTSAGRGAFVTAEFEQSSSIMPIAYRYYQSIGAQNQ